MSLFLYLGSLGKTAYICLFMAIFGCMVEGWCGEDNNLLCDIIFTDEQINNLYDVLFINMKQI